MVKVVRENKAEEKPVVRESGGWLRGQQSSAPPFQEGMRVP
jgi:hypothetical protein